MSSHFDEKGRPQMVDVSEKSATQRHAMASAKLTCNKQAFDAGIGENKKGNAMQVAELAGIMAAKQTANLIPLCHNLPLQSVKIAIKPDSEMRAFFIEAEASTKAETGVEMEAMLAATTAALTLYDMLKAHDKAMVIEYIRLERKQGGKSGDYQRTDNAKN